MLKKLYHRMQEVIEKPIEKTRACLTEKLDPFFEKVEKKSESFGRKEEVERPGIKRTFYYCAQNFLKGANNTYMELMYGKDLRELTELMVSIKYELSKVCDDLHQHADESLQHIESTRLELRAMHQRMDACDLESRAEFILRDHLKNKSKTKYDIH